MRAYLLRLNRKRLKFMIDTSYKTTNLHIATYLFATTKVRFLGLEKISPNQFLFVFDRKDICQKLLDDYWKDNALINPKKLFSSLNEIKDRLFAERSGD